MTEIRISNATARALTPGSTLHDHVVKGLQLRANATKKTWHVWHRVNGIERRPSIGTYPAMGLDDARTVARKLLARIALGDDPSAERQRERNAPTVEGLCRWYVDEWSGLRLSVAAYRDNRNMIEAYILPSLGRLRVAAVTIDDIERCTAAVFSRAVPGQRKGPPAARSANKVRALLSSLFNLAETRFKDAEGSFCRPQHTNPVRGSKRYQSPKHKRHSDGSELVRLAAALASLEPSFPDHVNAIRVVIYTGARPAEIAQATWPEYRGGVLVKMSHKTFSRIGEKVISLPPPAIAIIEKQPRGGEQIFNVPVWKSEKFADQHGLRHVWETARAKAGCPDLQLRDARRTYVAFGLSQGYSLDQIGELLGHTTNTTTKIYADLLPSNRQSAADTIAAAIEDHMKGE
jgi:integrase